MAKDPPALHLEALDRTVKSATQKARGATLRTAQRIGERILATPVGTTLNAGTAAGISKDLLSLSTNEQLAALNKIREQGSRAAFLKSKKYMEAMDQKFGGGKIQKVDLATWLDATKADDLNRYHMYLSKYAQAAHENVTKHMLQARLLGDKSPEATRIYLRKVVRKTLVDTQWVAERIARTEMARSFNSATMAFIQAQNQAGEKVMKRLEATFDQVTGADSVLLHGQTVPVDKPFYDPIHAGYFQYPPNRPNDREVVVPWRASWGPSHSITIKTKPKHKDRNAKEAAIAAKLSRLRAAQTRLQKTIEATQDRIQDPNLKRGEKTRLRAAVKSLKAQARRVKKDTRALEQL